VNLRFQSCKEKDIIGKRRNVLGRHGASLRRRDQTDFDTKRLQPADNHRVGASISGAIRTNLDDIRIRIGTDALTGACSTQHDDYHQSHASSDSMLFDQPDKDREYHEMHGSARHTILGLQTTGRTTHKVHAPSHEISGAYNRSQRYHTRQSLRDDSAPRIISEKNGVELEQHLSRKEIVQTEEEVTPVRHNTPGLRITQQVGGTEHPFRLVFEDLKSSIGARSSSPSGTEGSANHAPEARYAGRYKKRLMLSLGGVPEPSCNSEATTAAPIADEDLWNSYIIIPDHSSSRMPNFQGSEEGVVHPQPILKHEDARTSWSQHATQGDQSRVISSVTSASLPSLNISGRYRVPVDDPKASLSKATVREVDENERLWQEFVLDNNEVLSESRQRHVGYEQATWKSSYLPLSVAVSSISSTLAPPMHKFIHNTPKLAPPTILRTISSPAIRPVGFTEALSNKDNKMAERTAYGSDQSVTHASLQNNASSTEPISWRMFSHTGTSRSGPDPSLASRNAAERRAESRAVYDIADNEDEKLDLVDRDRLR
jgi:hypothetical protein